MLQKTVFRAELSTAVDFANRYLAHLYFLRSINVVPISAIVKPVTDDFVKVGLMAICCDSHKSDAPEVVLGVMSHMSQVIMNSQEKNLRMTFIEVEECSDCDEGELAKFKVFAFKDARLAVQRDQLESQPC